MQFAVAAFLKPGATVELAKYSDDFNERLGPSGMNVLLAGTLKDEAGKKVAYLAFIEADTIADARDWLHESPIYRANLYERLELLEFQNEVGRLN